MSLKLDIKKFQENGFIEIKDLVNLKDLKIIKKNTNKYLMANIQLV